MCAGSTRATPPRVANQSMPSVASIAPARIDPRSLQLFRQVGHEIEDVIGDPILWILQNLLNLALRNMYDTRPGSEPQAITRRCDNSGNQAKILPVGPNQSVEAIAPKKRYTRLATYPRLLMIAIMVLGNPIPIPSRLEKV